MSCWVTVRDRLALLADRDLVERAVLDHIGRRAYAHGFTPRSALAHIGAGGIGERWILRREPKAGGGDRRAGAGIQPGHPGGPPGTIMLHGFGSPFLRIEVRCAAARGVRRDNAGADGRAR